MTGEGQDIKWSLGPLLDGVWFSVDFERETLTLQYRQLAAGGWPDTDIPPFRVAFSTVDQMSHCHGLGDLLG